MPTPEPSDAIALACVDPQLSALTADHLRARGSTLSIFADLASVGIGSWTLVLVFADGFSPESLRECMTRLEAVAAGPSIIVVTDRVPPAWAPTRERARLTAVVTRDMWDSCGLALAERGRALARETEYSGPELPFTD